MRIIQWLRQKICSHEGYIENIRLIQAGHVACPCNKCGKILTGKYGLELPIQWKRKPSNP